jgi:ribosomal protein S18 acetylase RimI-like enzyme
MTEVTVRSLGEDDWREFKAIRLAALRDSPDAFAASVDDEEGFEEDFWRLRVRRSTRLVAVRLTGDGQAEGQAVGVVSLGQGKDEEGRVAEIFGLWVAPDARGTGVATKLVEASAERAKRDGRTHVSYWVGTDNGRAVAFASGIGFRPTDFRRPMRVTPGDGEDDEEEIAMVLPLGDDRARPDVL